MRTGRQFIMGLGVMMVATAVLADPEWKWVKANNLIDKWDMEQGVAEVSIKPDHLEARLYKPNDLKTVYITLNGKINDGWIVAGQTAADSGRGFNKFRGPLKSSHWKGDDKYSGVETITLTDGWSIIGLTRGITKKPAKSP